MGSLQADERETEWKRQGRGTEQKKLCEWCGHRRTRSGRARAQSPTEKRNARSAASSGGPGVAEPEHDHRLPAPAQQPPARGRDLPLNI